MMVDGIAIFILYLERSTPQGSGSQGRYDARGVVLDDVDFGPMALGVASVEMVFAIVGLLGPDQRDLLELSVRGHRRRVVLESRRIGIVVLHDVREHDPGRFGRHQVRDQSDRKSTR